VENINFNGKNIIVGSLLLMTSDTSYISATVIDGDSSGSVVTFENGEDSTAVLAGFTIQNGYSEYGGGVFCRSNSSPSLTSVAVSENTAEYGGGFALDNSSPNLTNVTISENTADDGGGLGLVNSGPSLTNVTMSGNTADHGNGGGLHCCAGSRPNLVNCILWNDAPQEIYFFELWPSNTITISYSDIQGDSAGVVTNDNGTVYWLEGNVDEDPLFVGAGDHPFLLQEGSPCIDAGTPDTTGLNLPPWDILGNQRIWDGDGDEVAVIDMGAHEYGAPAYTGTDDGDVVERKARTFLRNYPNPFSPQTTIRYGVAKACRVTLKVYNGLGQEVRLLVDEFQQAGTYSVVWDSRDDTGRKVPSGPYFLRLAVWSTGEAHTPRSAWTGLGTRQHTATRKLCVVR
jgi:hypothetical protein